MAIDLLTLSIAKKLVSNAATSAAKQSDWNQNDETATDYIKNRPFYEETKVSVLSENEVNSISTSNTISDLCRANYALPAADYVFGEEYIVDINGERYTMALSWQYENYDGEYYLGFNLVNGKTVNGFWNLSYNQENRFCLISATNLYSAPTEGVVCNLTLECYLPSNTEFPVTIKVSSEKSTIKKIDPKYIKDMYYEESGIEVLFEHNNVWCSSSDAHYFATPIKLVKGETYYVDIDGITYTKVATVDQNGNIALVFTENKHKGKIYESGIYADIRSMPVKIYREAVNIHKIDPKYLPNSVFIIDYTSNDYSTTNTAYGNTVKDALLNGATVYYYDGLAYFSIQAFNIILSTTGASSLRVYVSGSSTNGSISLNHREYSFAITI